MKEAVRYKNYNTRVLFCETFSFSSYTLYLLHMSDIKMEINRGIATVVNEAYVASAMKE